MAISKNLPAAVPAPAKFAHVVLRTNKDQDEVADWYCRFLGGRVVARTPVITFITWDEEHHRMAFMGMKDISDKVRQSSGLEHISFTWDSMTDLLNAYKIRANQDDPIKPVWCVNHGMTASMYYKDPDGNNLETQVDILEPGDADGMMQSESFQKSPAGQDFDPEELYEKLQRSGEEAVMAGLRDRSDWQLRGIETVPAAFFA